MSAKPKSGDFIGTPCMYSMLLYFDLVAYSSKSLYHHCVELEIESDNGYKNVPIPNNISLLFCSWVRLFVQPGNGTSSSPTIAENAQTDIYFPPWARVHAYMIGIIAGFIMYKCNLKVKMNQVSICREYNFIIKFESVSYS